MSKVLKHFDFNFYTFEGTKRIYVTKNVIQLHFCQLFPGHEEYKMMVTARNPYRKYVSLYVSLWLNRMNDENYIRFDEFLESQVQSKINFECVTFDKRTPDYFVRLENMYDDYSKIPFVRDSDYFKTGLLWEFCNKKVNESVYEQDWRDYYNQSSADLVYYSSQNYFRFFGYDKNSWKK